MVVIGKELSRGSRIQERQCCRQRTMMKKPLYKTNDMLILIKHDLLPGFSDSLKYSQG